MARDKSVRVELTRADYAKRGVLALVVVAVVLGLLFFKSSGVIGGPDTITARLTNAGGSLASGADVKMRGLIVGRVSDISRDTSPQCADAQAQEAAAAADKTVGGTGDPINLACVNVKIAMNAGMLGKIPANAVARILPATVFGTSYVDLTTNGAASSGHLRAGSVVAADTTQGTLELQKALDDIDALVKVIDPAKLNATLTAAASALDGRGAELGALVDGLNTLFSRVTPKMPLIRSDIAALATNLSVLEQAAPALLDGVGDSLGTLRAITQQQASLTTLLTGGRTLADRANTFVGGISKNLTSFVNDAATLTETYATYHKEAFTDAFATLRELAPKVASILQERFSRQDIVIQATTPNSYTAADCPTFGPARGNNCGSLSGGSASSLVGGGR